jgi:hypothetical protein
MTGNLYRSWISKSETRYSTKRSEDWWERRKEKEERRKKKGERREEKEERRKW